MKLSKKTSQRKVVKDGKVAVLYSPGFGAGWYSWASDSDVTPRARRAMLFDPEMVEAALTGDSVRQSEIAREKWPDVYHGGLPLLVEWVPKGARFRIAEYDGSESVVLCDMEDWVIA